MIKFKFNSVYLSQARWCHNASAYTGEKNFKRFPSNLKLNPHFDSV